MRLLLIRHADAESAARSDFERCLTDKGKKQARRLGACLAKTGFAPNIILSSPLVRARQTAELLQQALQAAGGVVTDDVLAAGLHPEDGLAFLKELTKFDCVAFVGHEPDCSALASYLLGMQSPLCIEFKKASCAIIYLDRISPGQGILQGLLTQKMLCTC